jgi:hypothetical protein
MATKMAEAKCTGIYVTQIIRPDQQIYDGPWKANLQHGEALVFLGDEGWVRTVWENGNLVSQAAEGLSVRLNSVRHRTDQD